MINHYKSWQTLNKQLTSMLCDQLKGHISYFLTRYHKVHNSYGRASIRFDNKELVCFSWINMYKQEHDISYQLCSYSKLKEKWDKNCTYYEMDFISSAVEFLNMPIDSALASDNFIIKIFAISDRRVGKRTLEKIKNEKEYLSYPDWVKQFYILRLNNP